MPIFTYETEICTRTKEEISKMVSTEIDFLAQKEKKGRENKKWKSNLMVYT
jgi:hypothetical protein